MSHIITDVLIVGGGGAACRAAIAASDAGADVFMAAKKMPGKGGATTFPVAEMAGYNAADPSVPGDIEGHYQDIVNAGKGMADEKLAGILAEEAPETIKTLEKWGLEFEKEGGGYYIFQSCFSSAARTHVIRGHGEPIVAVMKKQIAMRPSIKIASGITIIELIVNDGICSGAWGMDMEGILYQITAGAVVLATGGAAQAFEKNMNPGDVSGDGYLLGYQAGAELVNMEFMQAGVGFSYPVFNIFNGYIWAAYPSLSNGTGEKFLQNYIPGSMTETHVMTGGPAGPRPGPGSRRCPAAICKGASCVRRLLPLSAQQPAPAGGHSPAAAPPQGGDGLSAHPEQGQASRQGQHTPAGPQQAKAAEDHSGGDTRRKEGGEAAHRQETAPAHHAHARRTQAQGRRDQPDSQAGGRQNRRRRQAGGQDQHGKGQGRPEGGQADGQGDLPAGPAPPDRGAPATGSCRSPMIWAATRSGLPSSARTSPSRSGPASSKYSS